MSVPLLQVRDATKRYGAVEALAGVSFDLSANETVAVIGPNGAGKSTLFNVINGQLAADGGTVRLDGALISGLPPRRIAASGVARTFQVPAVFASMSVAENVALALSLAVSRGPQSTTANGPPMSIGQARRTTTDLPGDVSAKPSVDVSADASARALLARVGIEALADRGCAGLAYGDLKRVELAIALAGAPRLLLMDEPTAGMPPAERRQLMALVDDVTAESKLAVLFTEHDMDIVFAHADRILVLDQGRLIAAGTPEQVRADPAVQAAYLGFAVGVGLGLSGSDGAAHA